MQVLFPKHVWRHTECMPTSHWRTGASHISLRVITVAWWISSKQITDPLPTSLSYCCCYYCCYCWYLSCSTAVITVATNVNNLDMLLLLFVFFLCCYYCCYCCYLSCSAATVATTVACYCCYLLLLSLLLFLATAIARYTVVTRYFAVTTVLADTNLSDVVESDKFSC